MHNDNIPDHVPEDIMGKALHDAAARARESQTMRQEANSMVVQSFARSYEIGPNLTAILVIFATLTTILVLAGWLFR